VTSCTTPAALADVHGRLYPPLGEAVRAGLPDADATAVGFMVVHHYGGG
jgi:hypothetical protein